MLLRFLRLASLLLAALVLHGPAAAGEAPAARGFLWEATRGAERVLLLAAVHVGKPAFAAMPIARQAQLQRAEVIVFEANVFDARASAEAAWRWAIYPAGGPGLEAHLDAATRSRIDRITARYGGAVPLCCAMKPWMLANTLVMLEALNAGFDPAFGSEALLYQYALSAGKPLAEIESVDEQLRLFDDAALSVQLDYLRAALESAENGSGRAEIERLISAWERGDAAAMERLAADISRDERAARRFVGERLVRGRHPKMLQAIEGYARSGRLHLVAIGALHFFGRDGLLQQLRDRGFVVTLVP